MRQAIFDANANPGADTIVFQGFASSGTLTLTEGALQVTESVDIVGPGQSDLTVSGGDSSGIFWFGGEVGTSDFSVSELTLNDGNGVTGAPLNGNFGGSVLFFDSQRAGGEDSLSLTNVTIQNSTSNRGGGALHPEFGTLNIVDSSFINNTATGTVEGGGALSLLQTDCTVTRVTITGNSSNGRRS
ncbi:MAG: hypothetical protein AAFN77_20695 [Planctomycetota bacterium]